MHTFGTASEQGDAKQALLVLVVFLISIWNGNLCKTQFSLIFHVLFHFLYGAIWIVSFLWATISNMCINDKRKNTNQLKLVWSEFGLLLGAELSSKHISLSLFFSPPIAAISVSLAFTRKLNAPTHTHYFHWLLSKHAHMRSECLAMSHFLIVTSEKVSVRFDVTPFNIWVNWEWQRTYNSLVAYIYICTLMRVRWGKQNRNETNGAKSNIYTKSVLQIHWLTSVVAVALNYML